MKTIKIKSLVQYIEEVFFSEIEDYNGLENVLDLLFEFYQNNRVFGDELITLLNSVKKRVEKMDFPDKMFLNLTLGMYIGLIMGKFSQKIIFED